MVSEARVAAGASVIRNLLRGKLTPTKTIEEDISQVLSVYLEPETLCNALLDRRYSQDPFFIEYEILEQELELARSIAEFMLRSPKLPKPSLNRARYFIAKGGFAAPAISPQTCRPSSPSVSKLAWSNYVQVPPFLLAAKLCRLDIVKLPPDGPGSFSRVSRFLDRELLIRFFSTVRSFQISLGFVLDTPAGELVASVLLPDAIKPAGCVLREFNERQQRIAKSYSVENSTKLRLR